MQFKAVAATQPVDTVRIEVVDDGLYRVGASEIATILGVNVAQVRTWIAGGQVRLRQKGQGVAWKADPSNDALYFFGQARANPDAVYARRNVYLLDHAAGTTMQVTPGSGPAPVPGPQSFPSRIHVERNLIPAPFLAQDPTADFWYWGYAQT